MKRASGRCICSRRCGRLPCCYFSCVGWKGRRHSRFQRNQPGKAIGRHCIKVVKDQWILPEWSEKYVDLPLAKRRRRKKTPELPYRTKQRALVLQYLNNKEGKKAPAAQIIRDLGPQDERFTKTSFYKLFEAQTYFEKEGKGRFAVKLRN